MAETECMKPKDLFLSMASSSIVNDKINSVKDLSETYGLDKITEKAHELWVSCTNEGTCGPTHDYYSESKDLLNDCIHYDINYYLSKW